MGRFVSDLQQKTFMEDPIQFTNLIKQGIHMLLF